MVFECKARCREGPGVNGVTLPVCREQAHRSANKRCLCITQTVVGIGRDCVTTTGKTPLTVCGVTPPTYTAGILINYTGYNAITACKVLPPTYCMNANKL